MNAIGYINQHEYEPRFWNMARCRSGQGDHPSTGYNTASGTYALPAAFGKKLEQALSQESLFRVMATVIRAYGNDYTLYAKDTDDLAQFVEEGGLIPVYDGIDDFTVSKIGSHKLAVFVKLDEDFINDAGFSMEDYLTDRLGRNFGRAEDKGFITGSGLHEPTGILHADAGAEVGVTTGNLAYDDVIGLYFSVKPEYRRNGVWLMNDRTALALRTLKDADGNYLWNSGNDTILGKPVRVCEFMPDAASGNKPIAFGDFSYYWVVLRAPFSLRTLTEKFVLNDQIGYLALEYLDGKLVRRDAVKVLQIMSSLAQEESRSISENVTWGQRKRFADGKVSMPYRHFLGYRKGADGLPEIVPEEAELVRRIYKLFMQGKTAHAIGKILTSEGIPTPAGKAKWQSSTIESILQNEKYRGDARLQKKFTVDFLQKKMKVNEGEVPQYYVENSHPAIIDPEEWDLVQAEFSRRKALGSRYSAASVFSSMIFCGDCGSVYGSKVWHSTDKYRRIIWQCNDKFKGNHHCTTPHLYEKDIKDMFLRAFGKLMADREHILEDIQLVQAALCDCTELETQQAILADEMEIVGELIRQCIEENTIKVQNQEEYMERYERHTRRYEKMKKRYEAIEAERLRRKEQNDRISAFAAILAGQSEMPIEFNDDLWLAAVDHATVNADETVTFTFKSGIEITEQM